MLTKRKQRPRILLLMGTSHGYGRILIEGISQYIYETGSIIDFDFRGHTEAIPDWLSQWRGEGIIVRHHDRRTFDLIDKMRIPYVKLNCANDPSEVDVDEMALGEMAVSYFSEHGLNHFAYFGQCDQYWVRNRLAGYEAAVHKRGASCHSHILPTETTSPFIAWPTSERKRFTQWLHSLPKPIGLLTAYDVHAKQVLEVCMEEGIAVPEKIAVLGINNEVWFCRMQRPPLSSIIQNAFLAGYEAARLLFQKINGEKYSSDPILIPPVSVETRASTDIIAVHDEDAVLALRTIRNGADERISINDIVYESGLSRRTLERRFKEAFGRTLGEELILAKLEKARELLRTCELPIGNISIQLGFCSHSYFVHVFTKKFGETPTQYRRRCRT